MAVLLPWLSRHSEETCGHTFMTRGDTLKLRHARACYTAHLKFIAIVGKRLILRNLGPGLNYCLGFCVCIVFLNFSLFYFQIQ